MQPPLVRNNCTFQRVHHFAGGGVPNLAGSIVRTGDES